jgi:hypothetical protein
MWFQHDQDSKEGETAALIQMWQDRPNKEINI